MDFKVGNELISFYERRGYKRSGMHKDYPVYLNVGTAKIPSLTIEQLSKNA